jgi:hypothetical protein
VYQSEFPVDTPVPIFDPTLLAGIALVVLAVAILTYYVGKHVGGRGRDERWREVPKTIHEAVKAKCVAATSAPSGELLYKAQELVEEVQRRIGPVLAFGGPCAKALKGVTEALKGEPVEDKPKDKDKPKGGRRPWGQEGRQARPRRRAWRWSRRPQAGDRVGAGRGQRHDPGRPDAGPDQPSPWARARPWARQARGRRAEGP